MKASIIVILITLISTGTTYSESNHSEILPDDNSPLSLAVDNENLFLFLESGDNCFIQNAIIHLNKGRKLKLDPVTFANGQTVFYLDSKEAYKLKKFGIRNVVYKCEKGTFTLKLSTEEKEKIARSLP